MNKDISKTILSIEHHGDKFTAELPWDADIWRIRGGLESILLGAGFSFKTIQEILKTDRS